MGKPSRDKGLRRERALVEIHKQSGIAAERVPLSGATHYRSNGADIDIYARGTAEPPLVAEVKARGDGEGLPMRRAAPSCWCIISARAAWRAMQMRSAVPRRWLMQRARL